MKLPIPKSLSVILLATILCMNLTPPFVVAEESDSVTSRVAVVTGSNKGIGFAIVKGLCQRFDGIVYLTARSEARGQAAIEKLKEAGFHPRFHQLDINDDSSVEAFKNYINTTHGGLDILVNNAGVPFVQDDPTKSFSSRASDTVQVNYFGLLRVSKALFPLLKPHARVAQLSSTMGHLSRIPGTDLKTRLSSPELTEDELNQLMRDFIEATKTDSQESLGWPTDPYTVSKVGVAALSRIQQREFDGDSRKDLVVNAVHPGYVNTDMTKHMGFFTPDRGAQSVLFAALLPKNTDIKGEYIWHDSTVVDWVNGSVTTP